MKALIVEDDFVCRKIIGKILKPLAECDFAADGEEAITAFQHELESGVPYDLICLDIHMPKLDGLQVLGLLRKAEQERGIGGLDGSKVLMTTADNETRMVLDAFKEGCEGYVTKPFDRIKVLSKIRELGLIP